MRDRCLGILLILAASSLSALLCGGIRRQARRVDMESLRSLGSDNQRLGNSGGQRQPTRPLPHFLANGSL